MPNVLQKANSVDELTDRKFLSQFFSGIQTVQREPLKTNGFSGSAHEKVILFFEDGNSVSLIMKLIFPEKDMIIWRSGNVKDREATVISGVGLPGIWDVFHSPYLGYQVSADQSALLMRDLSPHLFADVREPITVSQEDLVLRKLAHMHARYWQSASLSEPCLANQSVFFNLLAPNCVAQEAAIGRFHPIFNLVSQGWDLALPLLPDNVQSFILNPPVEKICAGLPLTLIHGDSKLANFAIIDKTKLAVFDWSMTAAASPACEIGWYIAVNASRLARSKEELMNVYREFLQQGLGFMIQKRIWEQMLDVAVLTGAMLLLWNKAMNVQKNLPAAKEEWYWWVQALIGCAERWK